MNGILRGTGALLPKLPLVSASFGFKNSRSLWSLPKCSYLGGGGILKLWDPFLGLALSSLWVTDRGAGGKEGQRGVGGGGSGLESPAGLPDDRASALLPSRGVAASHFH